MNLIIKDEIFKQYPEVILGVAVLHNIDNKENHPEVNEVIYQRESVFLGVPSQL